MSQHDHSTGALPLTKPQLAVITAACSQHHVARLYLFGSLLRPDYRPGQSDIDLLVEFQPLEPTELVDAYFGLEEQLTGSLGTPVDLVMATARRNPIVQADIDATKQLVYAA
jgi:predicted nucleotidyltransferase